MSRATAILSVFAALLAFRAPRAQGSLPSATQSPAVTALAARSLSFTTYSTPGGSADITVGPDGALWFIEEFASKIGRITTGGAITEYLLPPSPPNTTCGYTCSSAQGMAAGPDDALWFTESDLNAIGRITGGGVYTQYLIPSSMPQPWAIAAGPDGALWFTELSGNKIGRITTAGLVTEYPVPTPNGGPTGIAVGSDGALWFTEFSAQKIGRITTARVFTEFGVAASSYPNYITAGPDGAMWFTNDSGSIGRITMAGAVTEYPVPSGHAS
jgi:virginiamycin B lyase